MATTSKKLAKIRAIDTGALDKLLNDAKSDAVTSREKTYDALAKSFIWFDQAKANPSYVNNIFATHEPPLRKRDGVSDYNLVVKLVFGMSADKHAPAISRYTTVLEYLARVLADPEHDGGRSDAAYVTSMITGVGGIEDCISKQREWASGEGKVLDPEDEKRKAKEQQEVAFLLDAGRTIYLTRQTFDVAKATSNTQKGELVLAMGLADGQGGVKIVDILDTTRDEIDRFVQGNALKDTSGVNRAVNLLGDIISLSEAITGDDPVVTVEKAVAYVVASLGGDHKASVVVKTTPKTGVLIGFPKRASLNADDQAWCRDNLQEGPRRRLYDCNPNITGSKTTLVLTNKATNGKKRLRFEDASKRSKEQVVRDTSTMNQWQFEFTMDMAQVENFYGGWLEG